MMKNIKIFDTSNKAECITWLSQIEAAAQFTNTPFCELIYQSMAPTMLHVLSELSALVTDKDIKNVILTNTVSMALSIPVTPENMELQSETITLVTPENTELLHDIT